MQLNQYIDRPSKIILFIPTNLYIWYTYVLSVADGVDYTGGRSDLYFTGTSFNTIINGAQCFNLFVLDDNLVEGTETLMLAINTTDPRVRLASPSTATVFIMDEGIDSEWLYIICL